MPSTEAEDHRPEPGSRAALRRAAWMHWKAEFPRQLRNAAFRSVQGAIASFAALLLGGTIFVLLGKPVWVWIKWLWEHTWPISN